MKRTLGLLLAVGLVLAPAALVNAQSKPHAVTMPKPGKAGAFAGPKTTPTPKGSGRLGRAAGAALARLPKKNSETVRGGAEAELYRRIAPSVVLVITDDGLGSGSAITKDGEIITSWHVVKGFTVVGVLVKPAKDTDKPQKSDVLTADVIKVDQVADLALLKIRNPPAAGFVPIALGDFSKVSVGDDVSAIGHPEGEAWTYTKGLVSQLRPAYQWSTPQTQVQHTADVIQTQTPINPGNSGGPLLDAKGNLIGVNAFKSDGEGLNFAVGVDAVQAFIARKGDRTAQPVEAAAKTGADAKADCKPQLLFEGRADDDKAYIRQFDVDCTGKVGLVFVLPDDKSQPLMAIFVGAHGKPVGVAFSKKRDGHWDISYWDSKDSGTEKWDTIGYHPDGQLMPSSYGPYNGEGYQPPGP